MNPNTRLIGIDFDNTIACYDNLLHRLAVERGFIEPDFRRGKKAIRDRIRTLPDGENEWQRLQAILYGPAIGGAEPFEGVLDFLRQCRLSGVRTVVVSHKTAYSNLDEHAAQASVNFRHAASGWLRQRGFFDPAGGGLSPQNVFYESTRQEKIERIRRLGCTDFIDDLEETFAEAEFPREVNKVLFGPHGGAIETPNVHCCSSWSQIKGLIFDECRCS